MRVSNLRFFIVQCVCLSPYSVVCAYSERRAGAQNLQFSYIPRRSTLGDDVFPSEIDGESRKPQFFRNSPSRRFVWRWRKTSFFQIFPVVPARGIRSAALRARLYSPRSCRTIETQVYCLMHNKSDRSIISRIPRTEKTSDLRAPKNAQ